MVDDAPASIELRRNRFRWLFGASLFTLIGIALLLFGEWNLKVGLYSVGAPPLVAWLAAKGMWPGPAVVFDGSTLEVRRFAATRRSWRSQQFPADRLQSFRTEEEKVVFYVGASRAIEVVAGIDDVEAFADALDVHLRGPAKPGFRHLPRL